MPVPGNGGTVAVNRRLLVDDVYERILAAIYSGQLSPGEKLNDTELCAWLGTSRTPIRQALARLETQGLVETAANRWTRVTPINTERFRKTIPVVSALYSIAAKDASETFASTDTERLKTTVSVFTESIEKRNPTVLVRSSIDFSSLLTEKANNPALSEALATVMPRFRRVTAIHHHGLPVNDITISMNDVVETLSAKDRENAATAMESLIDLIGTSLLKDLATHEKEKIPSSK